MSDDSRVRSALSEVDESFLEGARRLEQDDFGTALIASTCNAEWSPTSDQERQTVRRQRDAYNKARDVQENAEMERATQESLESPSWASPTRKTHNSAPLIEERIHDMVAKLDHGVPSLCVANGDTWVFIDPPPRQADHNDERYNIYIQRYEEPLVVRSQNLLQLGSSFFEKEFSSTKQYRLIRRRGLVGKLPMGIKFVLDLTPPMEGEDAVYLTTELCCPKGVIGWFQSKKRWGISNTLVGGPEEYADGKSVSTSTLPDGSEIPLPLEYTPLRHRAAIERVMVAIHDKDPQIDSAVKLWTTFAVAKYFDIPKSPLTDYIVRWLRAYPNSYFVEVLPEVSLKIADGLQCEQLCRDVFAILVGEEALGTIRRSIEGKSSNLYSVHCRRRDDLPEVYQTRVEYASKALLERITTLFEGLTDVEMSWIAELPEYQKLLSINLPDVANSETLASLKAHLKAYVRGAIMKLLCSNFFQIPNAKDTVITNDDLYPKTTWTETWNTLHPRERTMTRSFWRALRQQEIYRGASNFDIGDHMINSLHSLDPTMTADEETLLQQEVFRKVSRMEIDDLGFELNALLYADKDQHPDHEPLAIRNADILGKTSSNEVTEPGNFNDSTFANPNSGSASAPSPRWRRIARAMDPSFKGRAESANDIDDVNAASGALKTPMEARKKGSILQARRFFQLHAFLDEAQAYISGLCDRMLGNGDNHNPFELDLTDTLICLEDTEWKYLPIWANGNDDGSGGVYNDEVPFANGGFSTAGPHVHTRTSSTTTSSDGYEVIGSQSEDSTRNTSTIVNDGRSSVLHPLRTYAMSESDESWNKLPTGPGSDISGLDALTVNDHSSHTSQTFSVSGEGLIGSVAGDNRTGEALTRWETVPMEHMETEADLRPNSPTDRELEQELSNAFMEADGDDDDDDDDNDDNDDIEVDSDDTATELGDFVPGNEAIDDEPMADYEAKSEDEDEDMVVV